MSIRSPLPVLIFLIISLENDSLCAVPQQSRLMSHVPHFPCFERLKNFTSVYKAYPKIAKKIKMLIMTDTLTTP